MATVFIPAALRKLTAGRERANAHGRNLGQLIDDLERQFPGFRDYVLQGGDLKPSIAVSIDGEIAIGGVLDPVTESSEVHFLPALGGGTEGGRSRRIPALRENLNDRLNHCK